MTPQCVTWKNATYILAAACMAFIGHMAWAQEEYASNDDVTEIKGILVKCLIEKKC